MKKLGALVLLLLVFASCGAAEIAQATETATTTATAIETTSTTTETTTTAMTTTTATTTATITTTSTATTAKPPDNAGSAYAWDYPGIAPAVAAVPKDPYLIYVSRDYALPANYSPSLRVCVEDYPEKIQMEATAAKQYKAMYDAAKAAGAELIPYSGYRSVERQKGNFDRLIQTNVNRGHSYAQAVNLAAQVILPPGCSEHSAGLAMDITRPGYWDTRVDFETTKEFTWLVAHAHEYGFILRYPKDKFVLTQITYEPWHWRYVGVGPATEMKKSGQCLEEYLGVG